MAGILDGVKYPAPRLSRTKGVKVAGAIRDAAGAALVEASALRARVWMFILGTSIISTRCVAVSPVMTGPGVVTELEFSKTGAGNPEGGFALYYSDNNSDGGVNLATTFRPTGIPIFDALSRQQAVGTVSEEIPEAWPRTNSDGNSNEPLLIRPRFYVPTIGQFYFKVTGRAGSANIAIRGHLVFLENATRAMAATI